MEQRSVEGAHSPPNFARDEVAADGRTVLSSQGVDIAQTEYNGGYLESTLPNVFEFIHEVDNYAFDSDNRSKNEDLSLNDDEDSRIDEMKKQNSDILDKMSNLMKNIAKPANEQAKRVREEPINTVKVEKVKREDYGLDVAKMKSWQTLRQKKLMGEEDHRQEIAVARVRGFLDAIRMLTRIQSWWRMMQFKMEFKAFRNARLDIKRKFYNAWKQHWRAEHLYLYQVLGKVFEGWAAEVQNSKTLKEIVKSFYALCVKRLRLTPQAVMAYFAPQGEYSAAMSDMDKMKIRRLILSKLFGGWRSEVRELRGMRFKATQILARTVRRSKGPMWVKEGVLVTFHIWRRYTAVRNAYRKDEPDPQFKNPHLPQWSKLLSTITLNRIHRKRAQEKGEKLLLTRALRAWRFIMTIDKSQLLTPMQVAINHWSAKVWTKVFGGWSGIIRERGEMMRLRDKCFAAWKKWSPRKRRLRILKRDTREWLSMRKKRTVFSEMTRQCFDVVGRRAAVLRILRDNVNDRKVMVCAYGLMNLDSHVIMLDCWRRWTLWWKNRCRWKSALWQYRYLWFQNRQRAIFEAWRDYVRIGRPNTSFRPGTSVLESPKGDVVNLFDDLLDGNDDVSRPPTTALIPPKTSIRGWNGVPRPPLLPDVMLEASLNFVRGQNGHFQTPGNEAFVFFCRAICLYAAHKRSKRALLLKPYIEAEEKARLEEEAKLTGDTSSEEDNSDDEDKKGEGSEPSKNLEMDDEEIAFQDYKKMKESKKNFTMGVSETFQDVVKLRLMRDEEDILDVESVDCGDEDSTVKADGEASPANGTPHMSHDRKKEFEHAKHVYQLQQKLQRGLDLLDMRLVALAIEEGAEIIPSHIQQASRFLGDSHMPLFTMLLALGTEYIAERITRGDKKNHVLNCSNPLNAVLLSSHIDRWENLRLTTREVGEVTRDSVLSDVIGSNFQGLVLFRVVVLMTIQRAEDQLRKSCILLPEDRTMDEEVKEALKRKRLERLMNMRESLARMLLPTQPSSVHVEKPLTGFTECGDSDGCLEAKGGVIASDEIHSDITPWNSYDDKTQEKLTKSGIAHFDADIISDDTCSESPTPFLQHKPIPPIVGKTESLLQLNTEWTKTLDIYSLLREFTLLTNTLSTEARALRLPLLTRDKKLLEKAFIAQSRANYLNLQQQCMSAEQIREIKDKKLQLAKKAKEKALKRSKKLEASLRKELLEEQRREQLELERRAELERLANSSQESLEFSGVVDCAPQDTPGKKSKKKTDKKVKKGKKRKGDRKGKGGKKKRSGAEDNIEAEEEPADEDAEQLQVYDPLDFHSVYVQTLLHDPVELVDQIEESDFRSRCSPHSNCVLETWRNPRIKLGDKNAIISQAARICKQAANVPYRVLKLMKEEGLEDQGVFEVREGQDSLAIWILKMALIKPQFLEALVWARLPPEWWEMSVMKSRIKMELVITTSAKDSIKHKMERDEVLKEEIHENRLDMQDFLKDVRKGILRISEKRREKQHDDVDEKISMKSKVQRQERRLKEAHKLLKDTKDLIIKAESMLNNNNFETMFHLLGVEISAEDLEAAINEPEVHGKQMRSRAFRLIEAKQGEIPSIEENILAVKQKKREAEMNLKMHERLCMRGVIWLKNMAEHEFNVMLDTQDIVMRMARDEKKIQYHSLSDLRTLSSLRRHTRVLAEMDHHLDAEEIRLQREAEALAEAEKKKPKTRADFRSSGGRKLEEKSSDGPVSPSRRMSRRVSSARQSDLRRDSPKSFDYSGNTFDGLRTEDYEPLNSPKIGGPVALGAIAPREISEDERATTLAAANLSIEEKQKVSSEVSTVDPNAIGSTLTAQQRLKNEVDAQALALEMEGLKKAEQEAILRAEFLRSRVFDDYWELIIPQRIEVVKEVDDKEEVVLSGLDSERLDMDEPLGKTTRMWLEIGDQHMEGRRTQMNEGADGEDLLSGISYSPARLRPCDIDVGDDAWQKTSDAKTSVSIKTEKMAESKHAQAKKGKVVSTPEKDPNEKKDNVINIRDGNVDMATDEEKAEQSQKTKKGGRMFKQAEDPFSSVGKEEINHMRASITHRLDNIFIDSDDDEASVADRSVASEYSQKEQYDYLAATRRGEYEASRNSPEIADIDDEISVGASINSQQQHDNQTSEYLAIMVGEGSIASLDSPGPPTLADHEKSAVQGSSEAKSEAKSEVKSEAAGIDNHIIKVQNSHTESEGSFTNGEPRAYSTDGDPSIIEKSKVSDCADSRSEIPEDQDSLNKSTSLSIHQIAEMGDSQEDDDNVSVLSEEIPDKQVTRGDRPVTGGDRPSSRSDIKATTPDEEDEVEANDDNSQGSAFQPVSFVRISQQVPASEANAFAASEADKQRGSIELKRNAPEHNVHRAHLTSGGGFLEMPNVTDFVLDDSNLAQRPQSKSRGRSHSPITNVRRQTPEITNDAVAVLAGGVWSLVKPPGTGELPKNTDFKDSTQFQSLNLIGTAVEPHPMYSRAGDAFVIDGLVDHELADVFSAVSIRLAPSLGFENDHPSFVDQDDGLTAYGSLLEMVESELSLPSSSSKNRPRIGANTRGMFAKPQKVKKKTSRVKNSKNTGVGKVFTPESKAEEGILESQKSVTFSKDILPDKEDDDNDIGSTEYNISSTVSRNERLSNVTLQIFEENVRNALRSAEDIEVQHRASLTPEGKGGSQRPVLVWDRSTMQQALFRSAKQRREQRAFIRAGLTILEEEQKERDRLAGVPERPISVSGKQERILGSAQFPRVDVSGTESLDFDAAFEGILTKNNLSPNDANASDIFPQPLKSNSDGALMKKAPILPTIQGYVLYDEDIADRSAHKHFYDGVSAYPKSGSPSFRSASREHLASPMKSPQRKERLEKLKDVYFEMIKDDDDALEQAYAALLGYAGVRLILPEDTLDEDSYGDGEDIAPNELASFLQVDSEVAPVSVNVVTTNRSKTITSSACPKGDDWAETSTVTPLAIDIAASPLKPIQSAEIETRRVPASEKSFIENPSSRSMSVTALSTPLARTLMTPILSMQDFSARRPDPHFAESIAINPPFAQKVQSDYITKLSLSGKNSWGSSVISGKRDISPKVIADALSAAEQGTFRLEEKVDSSTPQQSSSLSVSSKGLAVSSSRLQTEQTVSSIATSIVSESGSHAAEGIYVNNDIKSTTSIVGDNVDTQSYMMNDDDEDALEQELRNMLKPADMRKSSGYASGSVEYTMGGMGSSEAEMEFVRHTKMLAEKSKKNRKITFGGGKMLPPINPNREEPETVKASLKTKPEKDPLAPKHASDRIEMKYPRNRRRNKFITDSDFPIKQLSRSLNLPSREHFYKGTARSLSDLAMSIDKQVLQMKPASDSTVDALQTNMKRSESSRPMHELAMIIDTSQNGSEVSRGELQKNMSAPIRVPTGESASVALIKRKSHEEVLALNSGRRNE